jgi:hypothetical protein
MADILKTGFGATQPANLTGGTLECIVQTIQAPSSGRVHINTIIGTALQQAGAFKNPSYLAVYVLKGSKGATFVRPTSTILIGMPDPAALSQASLECVAMAYINLQSQATPLEFDDYEVSAKDGEILMVVTAGILDGSVSPATVLGGACSLTVLGRDDSAIVRLKAR